MNQTVRFREPLCRLAVIDEAFGQDRAGPGLRLGPAETAAVNPGGRCGKWGRG
jgi:hypothetical protein